MKGDTVLESIFDGEKILKNGEKGDHVKKLQEVLIKLGFSLPVFGADGDYGSAGFALKIVVFCTM